MNNRVQLSAWAGFQLELAYSGVERIPQSLHREGAPWHGKLRAFGCSLKKPSSSARSPTPTRPHRRWPSVRASSSAAAKPTSQPMIASPPTWAVMPIRSPSGGAASTATAWTAYTTFLVPGGPGLFPPEDRHKVLCLATTAPAEHELPAAQWSLDDLAYHILQDAHYADMSRSTIQRILAEAELRPHTSRYWLTSHDADFEAKVLDVGRLYLNDR